MNWSYNINLSIDICLFLRIFNSFYYWHSASFSLSWPVYSIPITSFLVQTTSSHLSLIIAAIILLSIRLKQWKSTITGLVSVSGADLLELRLQLHWGLVVSERAVVLFIIAVAMVWNLHLISVPGTHVRIRPRKLRRRIRAHIRQHMRKARAIFGKSFIRISKW